jgi:hypothetical protein
VCIVRLLGVQRVCLLQALIMCEQGCTRLAPHVAPRMMDATAVRGLKLILIQLMIIFFDAGLTVGGGDCQALLTLLISNNFAEMKTSVFKRFEKKHLFQLTCSDMVERLKLLLFLFLIMVLNITQVRRRTLHTGWWFGVSEVHGMSVR